MCWSMCSSVNQQPVSSSRKPTERNWRAAIQIAVLNFTRAKFKNHRTRAPWIALNVILFRELPVGVDVREMGVECNQPMSAS